MLADWMVPFRALVDTTPDGMLVCDHTGTLVLVNAEAERMFGYDRGELLGKVIDDLVPDHVRPRHGKLMASYTAHPKIRLIGQTALELHGRRKDGSEFPVEISLSPYTSDRGLLVIGGVRDISERKQLEAEIKLASSHLVSAIEAVQDAFTMIDDAGRVIRANSSARQLLGDAIIGMRFDDVMRTAIDGGTFDPGDDTRELLYERWFAYHHAPAGTFELRTSSGRYLRATDRRTDDGGMVSTIADVTDLLEARKLAEAASAAKSEFLSSMSHELRTPLNAILGFAQLLEGDPEHPLDRAQRDRLAYVSRGGEHLLRLIDDVLDLSRIEDGRLAVVPTGVDVGEIVNAVARTLQPMAARTNIAIEIVPSTALPPVIVDRTRLLQILMNFGSNAIKYGRPHGHVSISAEVRGATVRVAVTDDGIGIAGDMRAKIFEPFQRAGQETGPIEGTGIGLTISRRLAAMMRSTIDFTSTHGSGSTFWIDLPIHEAEVAPVGAKPFVLASSPLARGPARHVVLYVEDNPASTAFMRDLMSQLASIELLTAPTAELGLLIARKRHPNLVLMDIYLGMSGFEAAEMLRRWDDTRAIPVVGLSAVPLAADANRTGFDRYLTKPVKLADLTGTLEELLGTVST